MKLAIDLQSCQTDSRERGIGRYALSLAEGLYTRLRDDEHMSVLLDGTDCGRLNDARRALRGRGVDAATCVYAYPAHPACTDTHPPLRALAERLKSRCAAALAPDVLLLTSLFEFGTPFAAGYELGVLKGIHRAVVAYDVIPQLFPERYLPEGHPITHWYAQRMAQLRGFDTLLAISESTRRDLIEVAGVPEHKIVVIGAGLDSCFRNASESSPIDSERLGAIGIRRPFVLVVGNADWRKNCLGALHAFAALPPAVRDAHQLVFTRVGEDVRAALAKELRHLREHVLVLDLIDETLLVQLYATCRLFFFPSFYEGFGLPVVEAMAAGAAVLSSNRGALPEVVATPKALFDPQDLGSASQALLRGLSDETFRAELLAGARERALALSWAECADRTLDALRQRSRERSRSPAALDFSDEEVALMADACQALESLEAGAGESALRASLSTLAASAVRRIFVDISEVVRLDARTGIQRVVRNYCANLVGMAENESGFEVLPIYWSPEGMRHARDYSRRQFGLRDLASDEIVCVRPGDIAFMLDSSWLSPERFDAFHSEVRAAGGEVVWMVYDLVPVLQPQSCDPGMPPVFRAWLDHVRRTADGCVCISRSTEQDLIRYFRNAPGVAPSLPWTRVIHLGSDLDSGAGEPATDEVVALRERLCDAGYCIALSTIEPRKDYPTILQAFERLWAEGSALSLVIIGKQGWNVESFCQRLRAHPELGRRLHWLDRAGDGDVRGLLSDARCLIQASLAEGFGLAVIEAGSLGVPLLLSDIDVFHEIAGDEAEYFGPGDASQLAGLLGRLDTGRAWRRPHALRTLSWQESSAQLLSMLVGASSRSTNRDGK